MTISQYSSKPPRTGRPISKREMPMKTGLSINAMRQMEEERPDRQDSIRTIMLALGFSVLERDKEGQPEEPAPGETEGPGNVQASTP
jgi:hypothetical protein